MAVQWEYLTNSDLPPVEAVFGLIQSLSDPNTPATMALVIGLIQILQDGAGLLGKTLLRFGELKPSDGESHHDPAFLAGDFVMAHVHAIEVGLAAILQDHPNFATAPQVLRPRSHDGGIGRGPISEDGDSG